MGPTCQGHVSAQSVGHVGGLKQFMEIWASREPIGKFRDLVVHFRSLGTGMTPSVKCKDRRCILLCI